MTTRRALAAPLALLLLLPSCRSPAVNEPPLRPGVPSGPTRGDTVESYQFAASAIDPEEDSLCIRFDWSDGSISGWSDWVASGETVAQSHAWSRAGGFRVSAQARDAADSISDWSAPLLVAIATDLPPSTPGAPMGPGVVVRDSAGTFAAWAYDPEGQLVAVRFDWGDGDTSDWSNWFESQDSVSMSHAWSDSGGYQVRVQARDVSTGTSEWSPGLPLGVICPKWRFKTGSAIHSSPAVGSDGTVYVGSHDGFLYAVKSDGTLKWRYQTGGAILSSPALDLDNTVYVGSGDGHLYAFHSDGNLEWRYQVERAPYSSPALAADGTIYIGSAYLYALNSDGSLKWRFFADGDIYSSPAVGTDGTVYIGATHENLHAVNPDGTAKWYSQLTDDVRSSPAVGEGDTVYIGSDGGGIYAVTPYGRQDVLCLTGGHVVSSPAIGPDGTLYVGSDDGYLYAVDPDTGLKWRFEIGREVRSSPAVAADGTVYVGSYDDHLYALDPSGALEWRFRTGGNIYSSPAIGADGTVYVGSNDGYLYAINAESPLASSAWPKFHHDSRNTGRQEP